jgi:hypothetical protein
MIPTRRKMSSAAAEEVAKGIVDMLMASWGLGNASRIVVALRRKMKNERDRRVGIETGRGRAGS